MSNIAIPIETKVREFTGKMWLSTCLANEGYTVALGDKGRLNSQLFEEIKPDLYIGKSATTVDRRIELFKNLSERGTLIAVLDTEGGVFPSREKYFEKRIGEQVLEHVNMIFAWGETPADVIRTRTSFPINDIHVTGNPRFDLLNEKCRDIYYEAARDLQSRLGDYVIINTNFTSANHYDSSLHKRTLEKRNLEVNNNKAEYQSILIDKLIDSADQLSQFPDIDTVVIRPHPSENFDFYNEQFNDNSSILVEHSGDVREWILGAQVVLHNSCTTGIESAMLNTPVIAFEPETDLEDTGRSQLPNTVSASATTVNELLEQVQEFLDSSEPYVLSVEQKAELERYFANLDEPAAPKIVETIGEYLSSNPGTSYPTPPLKRQVKNWVKQQPVAPTIQRLRGIEIERCGYRGQKFPGLEIDEVRSRLEDFGEIIDTSDLAVSRVNYLDDVYWIEQT